MRQYFVKYLPVEGEIKEGDSWMNPITNIYWEAATKRDIDHLNNSSCKKTKLFLCSRDIQIGDKVKTEGIEDREVQYISRDGTLFFTNGDDCESQLCIKVIGKISPEAVWVKEGMEFDEEEIKVIYANQYKCLCEKPNVYRTPEQANCEHMKDDHRGGDFCDRKIQVVDYIKILCPTCKKFH